jgi:hypothetical protein
MMLPELFLAWIVLPIKENYTGIFRKLATSEVFHDSIRSALIDPIRAPPDLSVEIVDTILLLGPHGFIGIETCAYMGLVRALIDVGPSYTCNRVRVESIPHVASSLSLHAPQTPTIRSEATVSILPNAKIILEPDDMINVSSDHTIQIQTDEPISKHLSPMSTESLQPAIATTQISIIPKSPIDVHHENR